MEQKRKLRYIIVFLLLGGCVVLLCELNICIGSVSIPVFDSSLELLAGQSHGSALKSDNAVYLLPAQVQCIF